MIAGRARVRVSRDGGRSYPAGCEHPLTDRAPRAPAAVMLFDSDAAASCLAADFDASRGGPAQVEADATAFAALIASCGGRTFADVSPNGGRHVYVPWTRPRPIAELRPLMRALCALYPSLDPTPMLNPAAGCIRPPGAIHRTGGHQTLSTPLTDARAAVADPCGPTVWTALLDRLAPDLTADAPEHLTEVLAPLRRGRLSERIERIARVGAWDADRYATASEARQAVVTAAAAAGWTLSDLASRVESGDWPGLAGLYGRYRPHARRGALARDLRKAHSWLSGRRNDRNSPTRARTHTGGRSDDYSERPFPIGDADEYRWIRAWWNAVLAVERIRWTDRAGLSKRLVLRALGAMAQRRGSRVLDVGRRGLALACALDDSTVAAVLRALRAEDDPVLELLEPGRGEKADRYVLRIPDAGLHAAAWRRWPSGRIDAIHPVFRELGGARALVWEALTDHPAPRREVGHDAALAPHTVDEALRVLAEHGLAERVPGQGWRRGRIDLDRLARTLGVDEVVRTLVERYRVERAAWRALLGRARRPVVVAPPAGGPWLELGAPPPRDEDDEAYDRALSGVDDEAQLLAALELLRRELGANVLAAG